MPLRRNRRQYEQLTDFDRGRIIGLREAGWSNRRIGCHLGRSDMVVARCWQQWTQKVVPSRRLARRWQVFADLGQLSVTDWRRVIFSDESRFSLSADDHRTCVWRRTGQRSDPAFIVERHTAISQGVTVWGAISWDTRSSLVVLQGTLTARRYVDDILTPIVLPMLSSHPGAIYWIMLVHILRDSPNNVFKYDVLPWPARSPSFANRACLGRAGKAIRYRRINCADAKTKGSSTGVINNLVVLHFKYDHARRRFVEWAQNEIAVVPDFHKRILFSDEAHFWLNGYVNKQNCRIWSEANPQVYVETPLHSEKLTVWCALWAGGIIGPYFFKNDEGHNITVNGDWYRTMITNFFIPELNNHDVQELRFQQDGATCHTARATIDLLKDTFGDHLISRFGPVNWPPRSCDLTPLDYFLWDYVKSLVYADKPQTLDHLEDNIRRIIADIRPQMLEKVIENWTSRLDYIRASRGSPMPEIIFKM
ncbi:DUF4817 domain-containing protein [Trichonephila clavipes]|nr:DUF4817 domain-containing protein [Trichonephila clavipes]